ncbi:hypothetical protein ACOMHN_039569 [Nucella lapillus]
MRDSEDSDRPQRRLARLDIDIAAVSEVGSADQGSLTEQGAGYALYWSGKTKEERRLSGVGVMVKTSIASRLHRLPVGHSDRFMSLRLPIQENGFATLIRMYAPTLQADALEEAFYRDLHNLLQQVDSRDTVLILGDFNARVGGDFEVWKGVLGRHGIGNCNDNGRLLLEVCSGHELIITDTLLQERQVQDNLEASPIQTLAPFGLHLDSTV